MKNNMTNRVMLVAVLLSGAGAVPAQDLAPSWRGEPGSSRLVWQFGSGANPATPDLSTAGPTGTKIAVSPGQFSLGWKDQVAGLGAGSSGFWDLGRSGTMTFTPGESASASCERVSVLVSQWLDGGIYSDVATVTVPGATADWGDLGLTTTATVGGWFVEQTEWVLPPGATLGEIRITGAHNGSIIDRVEVDLLSVPPTPVLLSVRVLPGATPQVEISWPASAGTGQLEWSTSLAADAAWEPLETAAHSTPAGYAVVVEGDQAHRFFRLKQR